MPWTELHVAAEAGSDADARAAIEAGVDVNSVDDVRSGRPTFSFYL